MPQHAGVSITVTSLTDIFAFGVFSIKCVISSIERITKIIIIPLIAIINVVITSLIITKGNIITIKPRICHCPYQHHFTQCYSHHQGCTNRCSLAAGLRGNGERMRIWGGNGEKMRKWREIDSRHFLILSLFPPSFSISSPSFHFLHQNASHFVAKC